MLHRLLTVQSLDPEGSVHLADFPLTVLAKKDIAGQATRGTRRLDFTPVRKRRFPPILHPPYCHLECVGPTTPKQLLRNTRRALTWQFIYIPTEPWRWGRLKWVPRLAAPWSELYPRNGDG